MWCVSELVYSRAHLCHVGGRTDLHFLYFLTLGANCYWLRLTLPLYVTSHFPSAELKLWQRDGVSEDRSFIFTLFMTAFMSQWRIEKLTKTLWPTMPKILCSLLQKSILTFSLPYQMVMYSNFMYLRSVGPFIVFQVWFWQCCSGVGVDTITNDIQYCVHLCKYGT